MSSYLQNHIQNKQYPKQGEVLDGQIGNTGGFAVWGLGPFKQLERFLILGSEGGNYYATEHELTRKNIKSVEQAVETDALRVVNIVREISKGGRAPKNDQALYVLAYVTAVGNDEAKRAAYSALPEVARIGTHLFQFLEFRKALKPMSGRGIRTAIAAWYNNKPADKLAYQMIKYRQRNNWTHADALRTGHVQPATSAHNALFRFAIADANALEHERVIENVKTEQVRRYPPLSKELLPEIVHAFVRIQEPGVAISEAAQLIAKNRLPREAVPTEMLKSKEIWEALLADMPMTALIRNLATLTRLGMLSRLSDNEKRVIAQLGDHQRAVEARVHPINVLIAQYTYAAGRSLRGESVWEPNYYIVDALESLFYGTFATVEPSGLNIQLALDVSSSMTMGDMMGVPGFSPRVASAAMVLVTVNREPNVVVTGFTDNIRVLECISPSMRLQDVMAYVDRLGFSSTNCALPFTWAMNRKETYDAVVVYTDSETNHYGSLQPAAALKQYRKERGVNTRLVVCGMTANNFTIADPNDAGMLDVVGFDSNAPAIITDFAAGRI